MEALLLICALASAPITATNVVRVDVIEINTVYQWKECGDGFRRQAEIKPCLEQVIFWNWETRGFVVRDWKMRNQVALWREGGDCVCEFHVDGRRMQVRARNSQETHTFYDPERRNREIVPADMRKGIR